MEHRCSTTFALLNIEVEAFYIANAGNGNFRSGDTVFALNWLRSFSCTAFAFNLNRSDVNLTGFGITIRTHSGFVTYSESHRSSITSPGKLGVAFCLSSGVFTCAGSEGGITFRSTVAESKDYFSNLAARDSYCVFCIGTQCFAKNLRGGLSILFLDINGETINS